MTKRSGAHGRAGLGSLKKPEALHPILAKTSGVQGE